MSYLRILKKKGSHVYIYIKISNFRLEINHSHPSKEKINPYSNAVYEKPVEHKNEFESRYKGKKFYLY